jgi:hypothetical protein
MKLLEISDIMDYKLKIYRSFILKETKGVQKWQIQY